MNKKLTIIILILNLFIYTLAKVGLVSREDAIYDILALFALVSLIITIREFYKDGFKD